jgi:hypothetical protein
MPHASCPAHLPASRHTKEAIEDRPEPAPMAKCHPNRAGAPVGCGQDLLRRPKKTKKSPAPAFHAASQAVRRELWDAYALCGVPPLRGATQFAATAARAIDRLF